MLGAFFRNGDKGTDINTSLAQIEPEQLCEKFLPSQGYLLVSNHDKSC